MLSKMKFYSVFKIRTKYFFLKKTRNYVIKNLQVGQKQNQDQINDEKTRVFARSRNSSMQSLAYYVQMYKPKIYQKLVFILQTRKGALFGLFLKSFQTNRQRTSGVDLSQTSIIMTEPFPPELDFSQVVGKSQFNASQPPPPPPR